MAVVTRTIYRKRYTGVTSGDRDGGYPTEKIVNFVDPRVLADDYGRCRDERYEHVVESVRPMTAAEVEAVVREGRSLRELERITAERKRDEAEFERLRKKLGK